MKTNTIKQIISITVSVALLSQSVFATTGNAGFVTFDDDDDVGFKIETIHDKREKTKKDPMDKKKSGEKVVVEKKQKAIDNTKYQKITKQLDTLFALIDELRSHIDRSQFDTDALLEKLGNDPEKIINFVTKDIYYEQYLGLLRGADGTLMSRAGNALDQSFLLVKLLKDTGLEARIVRTTISKKQAEKLLLAMTDKRKEPQPFGKKQEMEKVLRFIAKLANVPEDNVTAVLKQSFKKAEAPEDLVRTMNEESEYLLGMIDTDALINNAKKTKQKIIDEAKDYFYVEYRKNASATWLPIHPIDSHGHTKAWKFLKKEYFTQDIPTSLQHRFRFEVFSEQLLGKEVKKYTIFSKWEKPTALMNGSVLSFSNLPTNAEDFLKDKNTSFFDRSTLYAPILNYEVAAGANFFDCNGNSVDQASAAHPVVAIVQTVGNKFNSAFDALNTLGDNKSTTSVKLNKLWLEYTLIAPNGKEKTYTRSMLDLTGKAKLSAQDLGRALTVQNTFALAMGEIPEAFIVDKQLQKILSLRIPLIQMIAIKLNLQTEDTSNSASQKIDLSWSGNAPLFHIFDMKIKNDTTRQYRHEPSLIIHSRELPFWKNTKVMMDVVSNKRRSITEKKGKWVAAPKALLKRGIWETLTEGKLLGKSFKKRHINTITVFQNARAQNIPIETFSPDKVQTLTTYDIPFLSKQAILRDLKNGYTVIFPKYLPKGEKILGWWRTHIATGETLGMGYDGRGSEITEYLKTHRVVISSFSAFLLYNACAYHYMIVSPVGDKFLGCAAGTLTLTAYIAGSPWMGAMAAIIGLTDLIFDDISVY